ncbi:MAG TPA: sigma-54-dependent Fis family transcriptional regulator [Thiotrichales bacterium]|nr:sigma-54-dependent Fis family transcriptional regulator [Thiotrichales bacterium]
MSKASILVVEDDLSLREALCDTLQLAGYRAVAAPDGPTALRQLREDSIGLVVSDVQMEPMDGHRLLCRIREQHPDLPVVLMTAYGTIQKAVEAMREGATDYVVKPFEAEVFVDLVQRLMPPPLDEEEQEVVAVDPATRHLLSLARRVAESDATVMITGESGTGKEVFARLIHRASPRAEAPFVAINCAAIPENMLEAVLFGYEKGAFTGAYNAHPGKFEQANGGTLLLDEISEMDLGLQAKLLRVLQEREVERLGGRKVIPLDVRVLATSNRNLREAVASGSFREDLFYRLNVFPLQLPPLRERPADILPLARRIIERSCRDRVRPILSAEAEARLMAHAWKGNVRELDNVIQRALILCNGREIRDRDIELEEVSCSVAPVALSAVEATAAAEGEEQGGDRLGEDLRSREQQLILDALEAVNGSRKRAAERLGISPRTLRYKLARLREAGVPIPG